MATSEIPQMPANLDLGSLQTKACNSVRVMDVGFWIVMLNDQSWPHGELAIGAVAVSEVRSIAGGGGHALLLFRPAERWITTGGSQVAQAHWAGQHHGVYAYSGKPVPVRSGIFDQRVGRWVCCWHAHWSRPWMCLPEAHLSCQ